MAVYFVTDSGSDIPQGTNGVVVLPLEVNFNGVIYKDGVTLSHREFYDKLIESDELPVTSQVSPFHFETAFKEITDNGDDVICITLSSALSGTFQSANIAASEFKDKVTVIDSQSATIGQAILVFLGLKLLKQGKTKQEIVSILEEEKNHIHVLGLLDTLEYLKRGGRISSTAAFAGNLLSIKPVVTVKDGKVVLAGNARGSKQGNNYLNKEVEKAGGIDFTLPYMLGYTGNSVELLQKYIKDSEKLWADEVDDLPTMTVGGAIGTHVGPGAIAVAFFDKH